MKIVDIGVDGFGVWNGLKLEDLSSQVTVFYGPNEAGKTTLMQFVRAMLYGFTPDGGRRYLPPLRGGEPGGKLELDSPDGRVTLSRHDGDEGEVVVVTAADGTQQGQHALARLLADCDETIYQNVYAVGLREMQELGTLSATEAASHLYDLSAGLDRVSLLDVMRELEASRERLLSTDGRPSQITTLLDRRGEIEERLEGQRKRYREFLRISEERGRVESRLAQTEQEHATLEAEAKETELAVTLYERWTQRDDLQEQLDGQGAVASMPDDAIERLDELNEQIDERQAERKSLKGERQQLRVEAQQLPINVPLWREAPRIEALAAQREWMVSIESQIAAADAEVTQLELQVEAARKQLGITGEMGPGAFSGLSSTVLDSFRRPARTVRDARQRVEELEKKIEQSEAESRRLASELESKLSARGHARLDEALEAAGGSLAQVRRRVQLDERLTQMDRQRNDLEEQADDLLDRQMMPKGVLIGLGVGVVVGLVMLVIGLLVSGVLLSFGVAIVVLAMGVAGVGVLLERRATHELEQCDSQAHMLGLQFKQLQEERNELDRQLPSGAGPPAVRLQAAEKEMAELEQLQPIDAEREMAVQEVQASRTRLSQISEEYRQAKDAWRKALVSAGLPGDLSPRQLRERSGQSDGLGKLHEQLQLGRAEAEQRRRELAASSDRVTQLMRDTRFDASIQKTGQTTTERLDLLVTALSEQGQLVRRRNELRDTARAARRSQMEHARSVEKLSTRRRKMLRLAGAESQNEYRQMALAHARYRVLSRQLETLDSEIVAAISGKCSQEAIARRMKGVTPEKMTARWDDVTEKVERLGEQRGRLFEKRGTLNEQVRKFSEDRSAGELRLELGCVEQQLEEAVDRWQIVAVTGLVLDSIRERYEREQQPATLREASTYLSQLTDGSYQRVWTPLTEDTLLVDDAEGNSLSPEVLSSGTREQLFLSLRLALATLYAKRGIHLPLVLDDVLVNFDCKRAKAAAKVLRDFSKAGHQVLVFTCHEHILKMFKTLKMDTRTLPDNSEIAATPIALAEHTAPKKKKPKKKKPAKKPVVVEPIMEEPEIEEEEELEEEPLELVVADVEEEDLEEDLEEVAEVEELEEDDEEEYEEDEWEEVAEGEDEEEVDELEADELDEEEVEEEEVEEEDEYEEDELEEYEDEEYEEDDIEKKEDDAEAA